MAGEDRQRLADYVIRRRVAMGYKTREDWAAAIGLSTRTLGDIERARRPVAAATVAAVEEHLGWQPGSFTAILAGGEPELSQSEPEPEPETEPEPEPARPLAPNYLTLGDPSLIAIWDGLLGIAELTESERISMITVVKGMRGQLMPPAGETPGSADPPARRNAS